MASDTNVLSKKLKQGGVARSPLADGELIGETFARGVEDRLKPLLKAQVEASVGAAMVSRLGDATASVANPSMLAVLEIEDAETPGLIAAEAGLANHFVDLTLGGDPSAAPEPGTRPLTAVDMAVCRLHLDVIVTAFSEALAASLGRPTGKALRIREQRQNIAQLRLAPDYIDVLVFALSLTLGDGGRKGQLLLILPLSALDVIRAAGDAMPVAAPRERPDDLWRNLMRKAAGAAKVPVDAVMHRQKMSLEMLQNLAVGQVIPLPADATDRIELTLRQPEGRTATLATARLGAYRDAKVVKLTSEPDERVSAHIRRATGSRAASPAPADHPAA